MKRIVTYSLAVIFALGVGTTLSASKSVPDSGGDAVLEANRAMAAALDKGDKKLAEKFLDKDFAWTDADGKTRNKNETLQDLKRFATNNSDLVGLKAISYEQLALLIGTHHGARFLRIWVKRPSGWAAFLDIDTPMTGDNKPSEIVAHLDSGKTGDCDNPCRTLPYKPATAVEKAVLDEWQKTKVDEWHPDATDWPTHIGDEFMIINNGSARDKTERIAMAKKAESAGVGAPGAPVVSISLHQFGNAVVMITDHVPYQGGKPYYNVRIFVNRDGHWPIVWSQQTTIQAAKSVPPVGSR
jgi:Domain of unknown function (DUF4440)